MTPGREAPTQEKLRRFSRAAPQGADNIIAACITNTRHSLEAPLGVGSGVLASPAKRVPRDPAPTLCRALMVQAVQTALRARDARATQYNPANRRSREETPQAPRRTLLGRSAEKAQPARPARHDGSAGSWVAGSASLPPHLTHADHALE